MTVDEYLKALPEEKQAIMYKLRNAIVSAAPGAKEVFAYNMPGYVYKSPLLYFSAYKNHYSLFGASAKILSDFAEELSGFKINGSTIQFTDKKPLPVTLIRKIVKARIKENESKIRKTKSAR